MEKTAIDSFLCIFSDGDDFAERRVMHTTRYMGFTGFGFQPRTRQVDITCDM